MPSLINSDDGVVSGSAGLKTTGSNDGILALQNNGTTNVTVTAAGNVGIGTSSPLGTLDVNSASTGSIYARGGSVQSYLFGSSAGGLGAVGTASNHPFALYTNNTERARIDTSGNFQFNSGYGSVATAYGCRAWVNFNGTGTVAIRASGNVSSITDNGTGTYTVNFTNTISDADYSVVATTNRTSAVNGTIFNQDSGTAPTTSAVRLITFRVTTGIVDTENNYVAIFR